MKMTKKKIFAISLIVCALAILSMGTLAWFNAVDEVTNKFYVADSDNDEAPDFTIDVKESALDGEGNKVDLDGDGVYDLTDSGNEYYKVAPGDLIYKDPVVTNTGDYSQWVRVNVLISRDFADQVAKAESSTAEDLDFSALFEDFDESLYETDREFNDTVLTDYYVYAYYFASALNPDETISVFTGVNIPTVFTQEDMNYGTDGFQIIVKADAIQSDNVAGPASHAFNTTAAWTIGTAYGA